MNRDLAIGLFIGFIEGAAPRLRAIMNNIIENKGTFRP